MKRTEEMQKAMAETQKATEAKTSKLEQVVEDERKKTEKMQKAMEAKTSKLERAVEDERKKTEKMEKVVEDEQKKTQKMEKAVEDERKKTSKLEEKSSWLERELDAVKETANDTSEWIMTGIHDGEALRRIKLRTLLDRVQALLAFSVGVTPQPYTRNASGLWRDMLVGSTTPQRLASAEGLLDAACSRSESTNLPSSILCIQMKPWRWLLNSSRSLGARRSGGPL
ncbi:hypothetical protein BDZ97DRAFT_1118585 [Flammula alnicola]|nr:hypothetical protein BDZ97DRAFT_1118585 [Flammula alnicola]